ncbi:DNA polymerase III subunit epsilon [Marinobacter sp. C18]|uniref:3'-5' exonuclease n=1 Tax=Marinobacter sp. C18 TaxID=1772288 RepID=UPI000948C37B|nr:3'-5' exonuclease [Marinobacter sp. C18]OLF81901.1 DNA polymerase III subunit epsilon [Marinobacter sp. C18]
MFPVNEIPAIEENPNDYRLLRRVPWTADSAIFPMHPVEPVGDEVPFVCLDTETTGFDAASNKVIELGMVKGSISPSIGRVTAIKAVASLYEDPGFPIPQLITDITGIRNEDVAGRSIDDHQVREWFADDPIVIAHNAAFDRPFFENRFGMGQLRWACSIKDVPWADFGFESTKLEYLLLKLGYFYEGHRACVDALALAYLIDVLPKAGRQILANEQAARIKLEAFGCPFEMKDYLKARGYRWEPNDKVWHTEVAQELLDDELDFLSQTYQNGGNRARQTLLSSRDRYKAEA